MAPKRTQKQNESLVTLRKKLGYTQEKMAERLGIGLRMYQNLEAATRPSKPVAILLRLMREGNYR